jgi:hypothetical protein
MYSRVIIPVETYAGNDAAWARRNGSIQLLLYGPEMVQSCVSKRDISHMHNFDPAASW